MFSSSWNVHQANFEDFVFIRSKEVGADGLCPNGSSLLTYLSQNEEDDDDDLKGCQCTIGINLQRAETTGRQVVQSLHVISQAKNVEIFSAIDGYCGTAKGKYHADCESGDSCSVRLYKAEYTFDDDLVCSNFSLKLLSLAEQGSVWISEIVVYVLVNSRAREGEGIVQRGLDISSVRSMIGALGKPLIPRAEELLSSVEQYQDMMNSDGHELYSVLSQVPGLDAGQMMKALSHQSKERSVTADEDVSSATTSAISPLLTVFKQMQLQAEDDRQEKERQDVKENCRNESNDLESRLKLYIDGKFDELQKHLDEKFSLFEKLFCRVFARQTKAGEE
eukprot:m.5573 g.5573  ORF g.5573 m.5573 type:complete len:335 (+) comp13536_c0_seq1:170-1174(+)